MQGYIVLAFFLLCGVAVAAQLFNKRGWMTKIWLGCSLGVAMMMWLPSLFAFFLDFTLPAQYAAMGVALALAIESVIVCVREMGEKPEIGAKQDEPPLWLMLLLVLPLLALSGYLQYTHTLREVEGALHVGQSTYGDLNLHLGIATGLRNASYPPEYTLLPGTMLGYPFLMDALSTTMLLFGTPLSWSFIVPGTLMMGLVFWGFVMLAWEMTHNKRAVALAFFLLFLNGGLGFLYVFDGVGADQTNLWAALFEFYRTPTNLPALNLRWVNVIADMMVPQRTLLAGWTMVVPAIWMLARAIKEGKVRDFVMLGVWAGAMPLVHTHSFLALGLLSLGAMLFSLIRLPKERRGELLRGFVLYGAIAVALAAPQLLKWTFPQTLSGGSLAFRFNWVNSTETGLIDEYFWFWIKNVGLVYLLMVPAALSCDKRRKALACGALLIYVAAELIQFQPNEYDNNKLFYVAFLVMVPLVAQYAVVLYDRLKGMYGRRLLAACFILVSLLSGGLSLARETISDYQLYSATEAKAAAYVDQNALKDATFLTGSQHNNAISTLAGRKIVCGSGTFLYFHGVDYSAQEQAAARMYVEPQDCPELFTKYSVDYVYLSSYEAGQYGVEASQLEALWPVWYQDGDVTIFAVSENAVSFG